MKYSFETLDVWQYARELVKMIYSTTSTFPSEEKYGLISQLRRASVSVSSNIAEGSTRWSKKEKARFYEMAFGSLIETLNHLIIALDLQFISESDHLNLRDHIERIGRMLNGLYGDAKS
jgi:four helix bundle protein